MQAFDANLADILDSTPRKRVEFDLSRVDIGQLTLIELLDAADVADIPFEDFRANMFEQGKQAYLFYAIAWVIMRRQDKSLTYEEVCEYDLIVTGELDEEAIAQNVAKAKGVMAVATVAGVSAQEAREMTMNEVQAAVDIAEARRKRARRGRRK